ncbi:MAG: EAL domain-containing protein (putative c-di-GMP-specific phosphodiesterase class I) [Arenicella sp.]|jgi:EAL domain-containing protein (putative c-di-GMP-specific phosphodiesterase class I)/GGDEF domain-containing protein
MSLAKQFGLGFFVVLFLVFIGTLWVNVNNTRDFIQQQLASHAQDTATSLGLSITPYVGDEANLPIIESMTNVIFDRGYYQSIQLTDADNDVVIVKNNPDEIYPVPSWFMNMFVINAPVATTNLNTGWQIAGSLEVISNPGFGYEQLWRNTVDTFWVVFIIFVLAMIFVWGMVRAITRPLLSVVSQVDAISNRKFGEVKEIPTTPELKAFVNSVNSMSFKLSEMFTQISEQSEKYRQFAYSDSLTKVGNRRAFELAFKQMLTDPEEHSQGVLIIMRCSSLAQVNTGYGGEVADNYVVSVSEAAKFTCSKSFPNFNMYRLNGADFVLVIEDCSREKCTALVEELATVFLGLEKSEYEQGTAHIGAAEFHCGDDFKACLEKVDSALAIANTLSNRWQLASNLAVSQGNEAWREKIQKLIAIGTSDFVCQSIVSPSGDVAYQEWFARLPNKSVSDSLPMAQLIPASVRLDYAEKLDQMIVSQALAKMQNSTGLVGINVSRLSILAPEFQAWLLATLPQHSQSCTKLVLEIPERALVNDMNQLAGFVKKLKTFGVKITVERFGAQLAGITHLRDISPDFLKLDGRFIRNIDCEPDNQLFVQSLVSIAHGLNIKVIAEMVESLEESIWLKGAGIDYQQGYFIGAPRPSVD